MSKNNYTVNELIEKLSSEKDSESEFVSIKTYADIYNISPLLLLEDILEGKYLSAICLINKDEECKSSFSEKSRPKGMVSRSSDYILVKEYAAIYGLKPSTVMKKIHQGKYKTAVKESNKWYIHKDDEEIKLMKGYVTAKEFADSHGLKYYNVLRDLELGLYATAYQDEGRHWFLNEQDIRRDPNITDEFDGYISTKEYCENNDINYNTFICDVRSGLYNQSIKKKPNGRIFIREDAECITGKKGVRSLISAEKYALNKKISLDVLISDMESGLYKSAKRIDGKWYLWPQESCRSEKGEQNIISLVKYAVSNGVDYYALILDINEGIYNTVEKKGLYWFINREEECKTSKKGDGYNDFLSVGEFAKKYNLTRKSVTDDVRSGVYETAIKIETKWFIHKEEPCKALPEEYVSLSAYAELHGVNRIKLRKDVEQGLYKTAKKKNKRWLIDRDETPKENLEAPTALNKESFIPVSKYAEMHNVKRIDVLDDIKAGLYETAEKIEGRWYIQEDEVCKTLTDDYISLSAYAKLHGVSRVKLRDDVQKGLYTTVVKKGKHTFIKEDEEFKSFDRRKFSQKPEYISVKEYAKINGFSYLKMMSDVKAGLYSSAFCKNTRWYIDKNEPCKSTDKRKEKGKRKKGKLREVKTDQGTDLITVAEYAKLNNLPYQKVFKDVKSGLYETAVQIKTRWYLQKNESVKSVYRKRIK